MEIAWSKTEGGRNGEVITILKQVKVYFIYKLNNEYNLNNADLSQEKVIQVIKLPKKIFFNKLNQHTVEGK